jgi:TonB family protein
MNEGRNWMPYEHQVLLPNSPVPRRSLLVLTTCVHLLALVLLLVLRHVTGPHVVAEKQEAVQLLAGSPHVTFNPADAKATQANPSAFHLPRTTRRARRAAAKAGEGGTALQVLRQHAKAATAGMIASLKVKGFYGFSTEQYDLAALTAGKLPTITPDELPPRFEQYVTVEITIDVDGHVADARIVGGEAPPSIQQRLLAAIREFHYTPARHDGTPIPSQLDIVVRIPS